LTQETDRFEKVGHGISRREKTRGEGANKPGMEISGGFGRFSDHPITRFSPCLREGVKKPEAKVRLKPNMEIGGWALPVFRSPDHPITGSPDHPIPLSPR